MYLLMLRFSSSFLRCIARILLGVSVIETDGQVTKGEDKFEIWKLKPKGLVTRSYTTCCSTAILNAGGKWPMNFRPVNAHTVKVCTLFARILSLSRVI